MAKNQGFIQIVDRRRILALKFLAKLRRKDSILFRSDIPIWTKGNADHDNQLIKPVVGRVADMPAMAIYEPHQHPWGQLAFAAKGIMKVVTPTTSFILPPQKALWLPPFTPHEVSSRFGMRFRSLHIHNRWTQRLPEEPSVIHVSGLLRELILETASWQEAQLNLAQKRMVKVLIDQISKASEAPLSLKMPTDKRLIQLANTLIKNPANTATLEHWSQQLGASSRTLHRLFLKETQMGFIEWRQRLRILFSLERLESGEKISSIALDLGYESESSFINMFKKHLGTSPKKYFQALERVSEIIPTPPKSP